MKTKANRTVNRRDFLRSAAGAAIAGAVFPQIIPGSTLGKSGAVSPSNRINIGFIGTGRQVFYANLPWHLWSQETQVVAVCDVDSWRMEQARAKVEEAYAARSPSGSYKGCAAHQDFREVLARRDVDAVMISTPDHWHACIAIRGGQGGQRHRLGKNPFRWPLPKGGPSQMR